MKLTIRESALGNWYVIEKAEEPGEHREWMEQTGRNTFAVRSSSRFSDADVEGTGGEMLEIAEAIEQRRGRAFKRCAVDFNEDGTVSFWSPRNSQHEGVAHLDEADELAREIRQKVQVQS